MGRLLVFPSRLNPMRRWISLHHGRKGYVGLPGQNDRVYWSKEDFCQDDYDDKHVINCDDNYGSGSNDKNDSDTNFIYDNKQDVIENDHGNYDDYNENDHQNHNDHDIYDNYEKLSHKLHDYDAINGDNPIEEEEDDDDSDDDDGIGLMQGYYRYRPLHKKKGVVIMRRPRGLEGYWQRQAYLHSYKFTRRKSVCERAMAPMRKLRMAWGVVRGLYAKQVMRARRRLKAISNYANFHHTSLLLLSNQYLHPCSTLSFNSSHFVDKSFNPHS